MSVMEIAVTSMSSDEHAVKCPRCWHWHHIADNYGHTDDEIAADDAKYLVMERKKNETALSREKLCDRCQQIILDDYPEHESVPFIKATIQKQLNKWTINK